MIRLTLPLPPSVNGLYSGKGRRFKSKRYQKWEMMARAAIRYQHFVPISGPIQVTYKFGRPDNRRRDVFNMEKALSDFLAHEGVMNDDSMIYRGIVEWAANVKGVEIEIIPLPDIYIMTAD